MIDRRLSILHAIVREFIETAEPVGSKTIFVSYNFSVSPATIRNDMANLEEKGLIFQPHTSAGRVPTDSGYRMYVDTFTDYEEAEQTAQRHLQKLLEANRAHHVRKKLNEYVALLAHATENVSFATTPDNPHTFYLGFAHVLRQPEFARDPLAASQVMEVLEENNHFVKTLDSLNLDDDARIFIGRENILPQIQSCALIVARYSIDGYKGYIGILGPTRMRYPYNLAMVRKIREVMSDR